MKQYDIEGNKGFSDVGTNFIKAIKHYRKHLRLIPRLIPY